MVYNVILMNEKEEFFDFRKPLEAIVGLMSRESKRYASSKVTSKYNVICLI